MMGKDHFLSGIVVVGAVVAPLPVPLSLKLGATIVGGCSALVPDIDHPSSLISKSLPIVTQPISKLVRWTSRHVYRLTRSDKDPASAQATHRFFAHTGVFALAYGILVTLLLPTGWWLIGVAAFLGALTHDFGDAATHGGVPILFPAPIQGRRWYPVRSPIPFTTDGFTEHLIVRPILYVLSVAVVVLDIYLSLRS